MLGVHGNIVYILLALLNFTEVCSRHLVCAKVADLQMTLVGERHNETSLVMERGCRHEYRSRLQLRCPRKFHIAVDVEIALKTTDETHEARWCRRYCNLSPSLTRNRKRLRAAIVGGLLELLEDTAHIFSVGHIQILANLLQMISENARRTERVAFLIADTAAELI